MGKIPLVLTQAEKLTRYRVRNLLFRIRDNRVEKQDKFLAEALWRVIAPQLRPRESIKHFTFSWDVNPRQPLKIIHKEEWNDVVQDLTKDLPEQVKEFKKREYEITAFTKQGR